MLNESLLHLNLTPQIAFDTTIALIAHGADVNVFLGTFFHGIGRDGFFKRKMPREGRLLGLVVNPAAIFLLEECFNGQPGFSKLAKEIDPFVQNPTRKLHSVAPTYCRLDISLRRRARNEWSAPLRPEHCDALWPLIEKWERTGHGSDLEALQSAMEPIWRANQTRRIQGEAGLSLEELISAVSMLRLLFPFQVCLNSKFYPLQLFSANTTSIEDSLERDPQFSSGLSNTPSEV